MRAVEPKVFMLGETKAIPEGIRALLAELRVPNWVTDCPTDAEGLVETMGRLCYRSFEPGLNPNVVKVRDGNKAYITNIIQSRHGSVMEHATVNFAFLYVSRVFTHELVRHRVGTAVSQESLRFVRLDSIDFSMPADIEANPTAKAIFEEAVSKGEEWQRELAQIFDLDSNNVDFETKKRITSAMRRIAPEGMTTAVGWTANFRTLRHVIEMRTDPAAEAEIRQVFGKVAELVTARYPNAFGDYEMEIAGNPPLPWYHTFYSKV